MNQEKKLYHISAIELNGLLSITEREMTDAERDEYLEALLPTVERYRSEGRVAIRVTPKVLSCSIADTSFYPVGVPVGFPVSK